MSEDEDNERAARIREAQEADREKPIGELTLAELEAELEERGIDDLSLWAGRGGMWHGETFVNGERFAVSAESFVGAIGGAVRGRS